MIRFTSFDADGRFLQNFVALNIEEVVMNIPPGGGMLVGLFDLEKHYARDGKALAYPPKPGPWATFDFEAGAWVDPRSPADLEAQAAADLAMRRAGASLSRSEFCLGLVDLGILTIAEGIAAARGDLPDPLAGMLEGFSAGQAAQTAIAWAALGRVDRLDPIVLMIAGQVGLSAGQLDQLFGADP